MLRSALSPPWAIPQMSTRIKEHFNRFQHISMHQCARCKANRSKSGITTEISTASDVWDSHSFRHLQSDLCHVSHVPDNERAHQNGKDWWAVRKRSLTETGTLIILKRSEYISLTSVANLEVAGDMDSLYCLVPSAPSDWHCNLVKIGGSFQERLSKA